LILPGPGHYNSQENLVKDTVLSATLTYSAKRSLVEYAHAKDMPGPG